MVTFRERLRAAIDDTPYRHSLKKLSLEAGLSENQISNLLRKRDVDSSPTGPGLFAMSRVAGILNVDLNWLASGERSHPESRSNDHMAAHFIKVADAAKGQITPKSAAPTPQAMLRMHVRGGGKYEAFEDFLEYCDQYEPCLDGDTRINVICLGRESLSARTMGTNNPKVLQDALDASDDVDLVPTVLDNHRTATKYGSLCVAKFLNVQMPNRPVLVRMDYILTLLCTTRADGKKITLAYASLIA